VVARTDAGRRSLARLKTMRWAMEPFRDYALELRQHRLAGWSKQGRRTAGRA